MIYAFFTPPPSFKITVREGWWGEGAQSGSDFWRGEGGERTTLLTREKPTNGGGGRGKYFRWRKLFCARVRVRPQSRSLTPAVEPSFRRQLLLSPLAEDSSSNNNPAAVARRVG